MHSRLDLSLCYSHRFSPNVFGNDTCLLNLRECHFSNIFRVNHLEVISTRSRFCRMLLVQKEMLYDYYINQQGHIIIFYMMT